MTTEQAGALRRDTESAERRRVWRDATAMTLYVSIVLLAELAALPAGDKQDGSLHGPVGWELIAIIWGTTVGLALAHWFAFRLATQGLGRGKLRSWDRAQALGELAGAAFVALIASVPVLLFPDHAEQQVAPFALALLIGAVVYLVERASERSRAASLLLGIIALVLALVVATIKYLLSGH